MSLKGLAPWQRDAIAFVASALIATVLAAAVLNLGDVRLDTPFIYGSDGLSGGAYVKSILENGSVLVVPELGAPGVGENYEFVGADGFHYRVIWLVGLFAGSWPLALNLFYLLGYPLAAVSAAWSSRHLGVSRITAIAVGVVYALAPYHFIRGEGHLFLSAYYFVPPALVLALRSASERPAFPSLQASGIRARLGWSGLVTALLCLAIGSAGVYYAAFACYFFLVGGIVGWLRNSNRLHLLSAGLIYGATHAPNEAGLIRHQGEPEVYGLKVVQLMLPVDGHRIGTLSNLKATYRAGMRTLGPSLDNEAVTASPIGMLGSIGLVAIFLFALVGSARRLTGEWRTIGDAGLFTVWGIMLATVGGLGTIASFVLPELRAYNRISIYIAFASLLALALLAERLIRPASRLAVAASVVALMTVSAVAVLDQTSPQMAVDPQIAAQFEADDSFVDSLEASLPQGAMVFQLPYMPYPEPGGSIFKMEDYDPLVGYVHSEELRWSYGTMKGRETDQWQQRTSALPPSAMISELREKGFAALWVDRFGYEDGAAGFEEKVQPLLGDPEHESPDGRYVVWPL